MRRLLLTILTFVLAAGALTACGRPRPVPQTAFEGAMDDWLRGMFADSPELASRTGADAAEAGENFKARLDNRSPAALERRRGAALRRLAELRGLDTRALSPEQRVSYAALDAQFTDIAAAAAFPFGRFDPLDGISPYVVSQLDGAYLDLPDFLDTRHPIAALSDGDDYVARLRQAAAALDGETQRVRADAAAGIIPPDFILDRAIASLDAIAARPASAQAYVLSLRAKLAALLPAGAPPQDLSRAQALIAQAEQITRDEIIPAHQRQAAALRAIRPRAVSEAGVWRLPNGAAYYRAALKLATSTDLSPQQIHAIGRARVAALNQELDIALRRLGRTEGSVGERLAALTADPRYQYPPTDAGRAQLLADSRARIARVMLLAPRWFARLPQTRLEVRRAPPLSEGAGAGAYYQPAPLDGSSPAFYSINLRDMGEMTRIDLPTQDYHEAVPGHHLQIALARERTDAPMLRRILEFPAFTEGWAVYAEQLADEQDLYADDPIGRIGYLRWQLWRAARLVADTGLHAGRWTRAQAIAYLTQATGDAPGVIASEVDRYVVWPGQACAYELGRREIAALREEARTRLGPDFDLRGFHSAILNEGALPFSAVDAQARAWIAARKTEAR